MEEVAGNEEDVDCRKLESQEDGEVGGALGSGGTRGRGRRRWPLGVPINVLVKMKINEEEGREREARKRATRVVLSTVVPKKTTGECTCRRLMPWLREIGWEFVDIIVKSDKEPALTSLIKSWSTLPAMKSGSRMIIENSPVCSSKSKGIFERASQSVQVHERFAAIRSAVEETG